VYIRCIHEEVFAMKTVIDLDPELTAAAAKVLGTTTKKDTIHAALAAAISEAERTALRRARLLNSAGGPDLADDAVMSGAWS
jgi:Arc/MetJ family transcription regulator